MHKVISRISSCIGPILPLPQPRGPGAGVKQAMCHSHGMGAFLAMLAALSILYSLAATAQTGAIEQNFAASLTALPAESLAVTGAFYVPVYSSVSMSQGKLRADFSVTLSVHNASETRPLVLKRIAYFDTGGKMVESYLKAPIALKPFSTASARAGRSRSSAKTKTTGEPRYWLSQREEQAEETFMTSAAFDFAPLFPAGLPAPAARWTALAKYSFVGGNNDPERVPVEGLIDAANAVLRREGKTLATYGLASGPQGYRPLREFLTAKLKRDAGIDCVADDILIVSGSLQALDLVNATLLARGDTVIVERETYQGALNRLTRLGVNAVGIPLDQEGMRMDALAAALADLKRHGVTPKYIYTIPTVQNPTGTIMPEARRAELLKLAAQYGVPIFEDDCYADLIWDGKRPPALYAMSRTGGVIHIGSFSTRS